MGKKTTFEEELKRKGSIIYPNVGDSMMPLIKQGRDILIIRRPEEWKESDERSVEKLKRLDVPLYKREDGTYVLHRVLKVRKNDYVICGDHRYHKEYGIDDRHIIGVLSGILRDGKEISVESIGYRIYAHVWCDFFLIRAMILKTKKVIKRINLRIKQKSNRKNERQRT